MNTPSADDRASARCDCREAVRQLWDYLDGHLDETRVNAIREHLHRCAHCFSQAEFGETLLGAMERVRHDEPVDPALRERVLACLRAEGYEGP